MASAMRQVKLTDLSCDQRLVRAAEEIIESGSFAVSKPIRAGMTTSTVMACERRGWTLLALAPTRRILQETVAKASSGAVRIPGNSECPLIEPDLTKNPILRQLPLELPDCQKCNASEWCEVLAILRAEDYIGKVELYNLSLINFQNHSISSTNIDRENGAKLGIYNIPMNENETSSTSGALYTMFVNRTDCHAQQFKDFETGNWEFARVAGELTDKKIRQHVAGEMTAGVYQIALDDTVKWCCDDIDSHNGETDTREKVGKVVDVLRNYTIPFLLEASGSADSYHIWIFLSRTCTYNAYRFIRQINSEAGVECEAFPKQKKLGKNNKYGNLVKLPICFHNKSKSRSAFLDADTFEPLEGLIQHPGLVHLLEIPELSESKTEGMPNVKDKPIEARPFHGNVLRYCMQKALDDGMLLTGSGGHLFRLAIACEGRAIGMTVESVAQLFQKQEDFNYDKSLQKSREPWDYDYSPWSCEKIQDQCGSIVKSYCRSCLFCNAKGEKVEA